MYSMRETAEERVQTKSEEGAVLPLEIYRKTGQAREGQRKKKRERGDKERNHIEKS